MTSISASLLRLIENLVKCGLLAEASKYFPSLYSTIKELPVILSYSCSIDNYHLFSSNRALDIMKPYLVKMLICSFKGTICQIVP